MERYKNLGGNSGIIMFEISDDGIVVQFKDGGTYLYNHTAPGKDSVNHMKSLAQTGMGLNSYISSVVKKNYAKKLR